MFNLNLNLIVNYYLNVWAKLFESMQVGLFQNLSLPASASLAVTSDADQTKSLKQPLVQNMLAKNQWLNVSVGNPIVLAPACRSITADWTDKPELRVSLTLTSALSSWMVAHTQFLV